MQFGDRRLEHRLAPIILQTPDPVNQRAGGLDPQLHVDDSIRNRLITADRLAELMPGLHESNRFTELPLHSTDMHGKDRSSLPFHGTIEAGRTFSRTSQDRISGNAATVHRDRAGLGRSQSHLVQRGGTRQSRSVPGNQEARHPKFAPGRIDGAVDDHDVRDGTVGDEALGSIKNPVIAILLRGAGHGEDIGTGIGFRRPMPRDEGTVQQSRKPPTFLLIGSETHDRYHPRPEMGVDREQEPQVVHQPAERLHRHDGRKQTDATAAIRLGDRQPDDPGFGTRVPSRPPEGALAISLDAGFGETASSEGLHLPLELGDVFGQFHAIDPNTGCYILYIRMIETRLFTPRAGFPHLETPMPSLTALITIVLVTSGEEPASGGFGEDWMGSDAPLFQEALDLAGLDSRDFRFDEAVVGTWGGDRWRSPMFDLFFTDPWKCSPYAREHATAIAAAAANIHDIQFLAQSDTGIRVRDNYYGSFLTEAKARVDTDGESSLANALAELGGGDPDQIMSTASYRSIPEAARDAAAIVLHATLDAESYRRLGLIEPLTEAGIDPNWAGARAFDECFWRAADDDDANLETDAKFDEVRRTLRTEAAMEAIDRHLIARGANLLALAVDEAVRRLDAAAPFEAPDLDASFQTTMGNVRFLGTASDRIGEHGHDLLTIDLGGDDLWTRGGASGDLENNPIGIAIDHSGDDRYIAPASEAWLQRLESGPTGGEPGFRQERPDEHAPAFGAGVGGYGILVDVSGDDSYIAPVAGMGCGLLGHGVLQDRDGDDRYRGDAGAMGSGTFGTGVLADLAGNDEYRLLHKGMGYGGTLGAGILVDTSGNDTYLAEVDRIKYSWFDDFGTQLNMTQGFGYGRRADMDDGHSWAGGVGALVDTGGGDDRHQCGIYGIGCAYWYALGILYDDGGNDRYESDSYSIASPPHFAVGIVIDEAGDDVWRGRSSRCCGFGRDFSLGWFEEGGGDDIYLCSDSAFGVGNVNGLGVCWDKGGNDAWCARSNSFGQPYVESRGRRDFPINAGLFIDAGGRDRYLRTPPETSTWTIDPRQLDEMETWEFLGDGVRHHWRDHRPTPGSTGAAIDSGT